MTLKRILDYLLTHKLAVISLTLPLVLTACAGLKGMSSTNSEQKPIWSYGNYCGGDYPKYSVAIRPVDDLDLICYYHDKCYEIEGKPLDVCDSALFHNLRYFSNSKRKTSIKCSQLAVEIQQFSLSNSVVTQDSLFGKAVMALPTAIMNIGLAPMYLTAAAMGNSSMREVDACNLSLERIKYIAPLNAKELERMKECRDLKFCSGLTYRGRL
jgi:hypothetical protein